MKLKSASVFKVPCPLYQHKSRKDWFKTTFTYDCVLIWAEQPRAPMAQPSRRPGRLDRGGKRLFQTNSLKLPVCFLPQLWSWSNMLNFETIHDGMACPEIAPVAAFWIRIQCMNSGSLLSSIGWFWHNAPCILFSTKSVIHVHCVKFAPRLYALSFHDTILQRTDENNWE